VKEPGGSRVVFMMLAGFGDACRAVGGLPAAVAAWRRAVQVVDDPGWPDLLGVGAGLERAGLPSPQC
jgi:hypothetical protein